jgi:hypothetical protein
VPEVAEIFRAHGASYRQQQRGHLSLGQLKVMSAIERCRSAALGGHVLRCSACAQPQIAYNSCLMGSPPLWCGPIPLTVLGRLPLHVQLSIKAWLSAAPSVCPEAGTYPCEGAAVQLPQ